MEEGAGAEGTDGKVHSNNVSLSASTDQIDAPLVFQCKKCNAIISDSFAFQVADEGLRAVIVHTACNVSFQANSLITSKKGIDIGSTYTLVSCATPECKAPLGRLYKTTARHLDHIREMFTFDVDAIKSYKLGSCPSISEYGSTPSAVIPSAQHMQQMEEKLVKMQHLLLLFNEKMTSIEKYLGENVTSPSTFTQPPAPTASTTSTSTTTTTTTTAAAPALTKPPAAQNPTISTPTSTNITNATPKAPTMSTPTTARPPTKFLTPSGSATTPSSSSTTTTSNSTKRDFIGVPTSNNRNPATNSNGTSTSSTSPGSSANNNATATDPKKRKKY
eukprot:TRINITY_DN14203_c0_g1_i1.p1 TRINITY_DN14203_c0_g1~~TRINITY_DN14203_c0_g1_i1.p1  ORF type:complete len:332 (-),score=86.42 TRINITY_DN14203_c0_g1_i1:173-1168(-)